MARFLLVHGSWHGEWCWARVRPLLEAAGHRVETPCLIGMGERVDEISPKTGLAAHIVQIAELVNKQPEPAVLVGHSYSGLILEAVAHRDPKRISGLVHLDTLVPRDGESAFDLMPGVEEGWRQVANEEGEGWWIPPLMSPQALGVTDPRDVTWVEEHLTRMALATHVEKTPLPPSVAASRIPRTYVHCKRFGLGAPFAARARREGWTVIAVDTGHDLMITAPRETADAILQSRRTR